MLIRSRLGISFGNKSFISTIFFVNDVILLFVDLDPPIRRMSGLMLLGATLIVSKINFLGCDLTGLPNIRTVSSEMRDNIFLIS